MSSAGPPSVYIGQYQLAAPSTFSPTSTVPTSPAPTWTQTRVAFPWTWPDTSPSLDLVSDSGSPEWGGGR